MRLVLATVAAALLLAGCGADAAPTASTATSTPTATKSALRTAIEGCGLKDLTYTVLGDDEHTLTIDGAKITDPDTGLPFDDEVCVLRGLAVPDSVLSQMDATRALDGMQDATWGDYTARWTYHPDDGLDVIITGR